MHGLLHRLQEYADISLAFGLLRDLHMSVLWDHISNPELNPHPKGPGLSVKVFLSCMNCLLGLNKTCLHVVCYSLLPLFSDQSTAAAHQPSHCVLGHTTMARQ
jgi:hypothetical protein